MDGSHDLHDGTLYERDFHAWARAQADALRARDADAIDWTNVVEEIESLGRAERSSLKSCIVTILEHRLKLDHGIVREPVNKWRASIMRAQTDVMDNLADNPSLRREVPELIGIAYRSARRKALASFEEYEPERVAHYEAALPRDCPYGEADVLDPL